MFTVLYYEGIHSPHRHKKMSAAVRRLLPANSARANTTLVTARRSYTDYEHRKYPVLYQVTWGLPIFYSVPWFVLFLGGSVIWKKRSEWKKDTLRYWHRKHGTGYKWGNDFGPEIKNVFKNIPSSAV